jgi:hypothetical protein
MTFPHHAAAGRRCRRRFLRLLPVSAAVLGAWPAAAEPRAEGDTRVYRETGDQTRTFTLRITPLPGARERLESVSGETRFVTVCDSRGETLSWTLESPGARVRAESADSRIAVSGTRDGRRLREEYATGGLPWIQALSRGLRDRPTPGAEPLRFVMLRPDSLEPVKLEAVPDARGHDGTPAPTGVRRIRVRGTGPVARLCYGLHDFRREDGVFLRYEGLFGLPGLPRSSVRIVPGAPQGDD